MKSKIQAVLTSTPIAGSFGRLLTCLGLAAALAGCDGANAPSVAGSTETSTAVVPQTGIWWNPSEAGLGYAIEAQGDRVALGAYLYETTGAAVWYFGLLSRQADNSYFGELLRYSGGPALGAPYRAPTATRNVASVTFTPATPASGSLVIRLAEGGTVKTVKIQRFYK